MNTDLTIRKGATFAIAVEVPGIDDPDYTALCYIKKSANDLMPLLECTIVKILPVPPAIGPVCYFRVSLTAEQTLTLKTSGVSPMNLEQYVYDIIVSDSAGQIVRVLEGYIWVSPGVTV